MLYIMWREKTNRIKRTAADVFIAWLCVSIETSGIVLIYMMAQSTAEHGTGIEKIKLMAMILEMVFGLAAAAAWMIRIIIELSNGEREIEIRTIMEALGYRTSRLMQYCKLSSMTAMAVSLLPAEGAAWFVCYLLSRQKIIIFGVELPIKMLEGAQWWCFVIPVVLLVLEVLMQQFLQIKRNNIFYGKEIVERL